MQKTVILDTNFLLIPGQFKVDIFAELERVCSFKYRICVLKETIGELDKIVASDSSTNSFKDRRAAKLGLALLKAKKAEIVSDNAEESRKVFKSTDKAILDFAVALNKSVPGSAVVATQDRKLRDSLVEKGVAVVILRQEKYLRFYSQR